MDLVGMMIDKRGKLLISYGLCRSRLLTSPSCRRYCRGPALATQSFRLIVLMLLEGDSELNPVASHNISVLYDGLLNWALLDLTTYVSALQCAANTISESFDKNTCGLRLSASRCSRALMHCSPKQNAWFHRLPSSAFIVCNRYRVVSNIQYNAGCTLHRSPR